MEEGYSVDRHHEYLVVVERMRGLLMRDGGQRR